MDGNGTVHLQYIYLKEGTILRNLQYKKHLSILAIIGILALIFGIILGINHHQKSLQVNSQLPGHAFTVLTADENDDYHANKVFVFGKGEHRGQVLILARSQAMMVKQHPSEFSFYFNGAQYRHYYSAGKNSLKIYRESQTGGDRRQTLFKMPNAGVHHGVISGTCYWLGDDDNVFNQYKCKMQKLF